MSLLLLFILLGGGEGNTEINIIDFYRSERLFAWFVRSGVLAVLAKLLNRHESVFLCFVDLTT